MTLGGRPLKKYRISHGELVGGGRAGFRITTRTQINNICPMNLKSLSLSAQACFWRPARRHRTDSLTQYVDMRIGTAATAVFMGANVPFGAVCLWPHEHPVVD